eukprot:7589882-Alexandrium_andersonii.AAC.1
MLGQVGRQMLLLPPCADRCTTCAAAAAAQTSRSAFSLRMRVQARPSCLAVSGSLWGLIAE